MSEPIEDPITRSEDAPKARVEPDRLLLRARDGTSVVVESPRRLGSLVRLDGRIYELRGVDQRGGKWVRLYREIRVDDVAVVGVR